MAEEVSGSREDGKEGAGRWEGGNRENGKGGFSVTTASSTCFMIPEAATSILYELGENP